jgi:hypothetical protein
VCLNRQQEGGLSHGKRVRVLENVKTHVPALSGPNCPSTPLTGATISGQATLVSGAENDTVIVWFVESTAMAGFPQQTDAKQELM